MAGLSAADVGAVRREELVRESCDPGEEDQPGAPHASPGQDRVRGGMEHALMTDELRRAVGLWGMSEEIGPFFLGLG